MNPPFNIDVFKGWGDKKKYLDVDFVAHCYENYLNDNGI